MTKIQSVLLPEIASGPVVAKFDQEHSSSDGGALLRKAVDDRLGLSGRLAACVEYPRQPGKVQRAMLELLRQGIFATTWGDPGRQRRRIHLESLRCVGVPAWDRGGLHPAWEACRERLHRVIQREASG
jgi:hypothetical protein